MYCRFTALLVGRGRAQAAEALAGASVFRQPGTVSGRYGGLWGYALLGTGIERAATYRSGDGANFRETVSQDQQERP